MLAIQAIQSSAHCQQAPMPALASANHVLIRVRLAGICRTDIEVAKGNIPCADEVILGHEFCGDVHAVGEAVTHLQVGQRVGVMPVIKADAEQTHFYDSTMLGVDHAGAFAEYICVPASTAFVLPDHLSDQQGAYLEPITAALSVLNADILPEQRGLIYGDNRISRLMERILSIHGFQVDVVDHDHSASLANNTYDYVVESMANDATLLKICDVLKPKGLLVVKSRQHHPVATHFNTLVTKELRFQAVNYGDFAQAIALLADQSLKVDDLLGAVYDLQDFEQAFADSLASESKKLFLRPPALGAQA